MALPYDTKYDINHDGSIDILDISRAGAAFLSHVGGPGFLPEADFDNDGYISILDITRIAQHFGTSQNLWLLPGAVNSPWRTRIGVWAQLSSAGLPRASAQDYEIELIIADPTAPQRTAYGDPDSLQTWWPEAECNTNMQNRGNIYPITDGLTMHVSDTEGSLPNLSGGVVLADKVTVQEFQYATRCDPTGPLTAGAWRGSHRLDGAGVGGTLAHGGSVMSGFFGSLRAWEVAAGWIAHPLKLTLGAQVCAAGRDGKGYVWPAYAADNGWNVNGHQSQYTGSAPYVCMGSLLTLENEISGSMRTVVGKMLARTLFLYGAYVVDTGPQGYDPRSILMEKPALAAITAKGGIPWGTGNLQQDWLDLTSALSVVVNNTPTTIGGGGPPRSGIL